MAHAKAAPLGVEVFGLQRFKGRMPCADSRGLDRHTPQIDQAEFAVIGTPDAGVPIMKSIIVVYDLGAAPPADIAVGLTDWAKCIFVAERNEHTRMMEPLLSQFGPVVWADVIDEAVEELRKYAPEGIVTFSEKAMKVTAELAGRLGLRYHSATTSNLLTDKFLQREALHAAGIDSVRFDRINSAEDWTDAVTRVGLPAVLKPAFGGASTNVFLIQDIEEGRQLVGLLISQGAPGYGIEQSMVLEEYLVGRDSAPFGDYVSIEQITQDGHTTDIAITGKFPMIPPFRETGRFWPSPLEDPESAQVFSLARDALQALGITTGLTHTEVKLTAAGPRVIEVNGRLGGGVNELSIRSGDTNLIELAGRVALGEPYAAQGVTADTRGRFIYQITNSAPRGSCKFIGVDGAEEISRLLGVSLYRPWVRPGTALAGGVNTTELGIVTGIVQNKQELSAVFDQVQSTLQYKFLFPEPVGAVAVMASDLDQF